MRRGGASKEGPYDALLIVEKNLRKENPCADLAIGGEALSARTGKFFLGGCTVLPTDVFPGWEKAVENVMEQRSCTGRKGEAFWGPPGLRGKKPKVKR